MTPGTKLGPYEILAPIGAGGMGEVYRARDSRLSRDVAIKVSAEQFNERFEREARSIASLNHTNVCHLYDVGPNYLVMELVEGETLRGPMPFAEALPIIRQLIDGIEAAHDRNIIHRDLKPANIKVTPEGVVKILDFGLAKAMAPEAEGTSENSPTVTMGATTAGTILGTAAYMAPEQAKGKTADKRSDIWSFGVVVYELLSGKKPFDGESVVETLGAVINKEPDWSGVSERVRRLLQWCLEKDRKQRLQSIGDARRVLETAATEDAVPAASRSPLVRLLAAAFAAALLLLGVLSFVHFRGTQPELRTVRLQIPPPEKGSFQSFSISPDGRTVVFTANNQFWIRTLDSLDARPLAGTEATTGAVSGVFWSPDSQFVGFWRQGKLQKVAVSGGPAQVLCDVTSFTGGTWNRDGVIVFGQIPSLFRVSDAGGAPVPVTKGGEGQQLHVLPEFLPDGHHFIYTIVTGKPEAAGVFVGSLDGEPSVRLLADVTHASYAPSVQSGYLMFGRGDTILAQPFNPERRRLSGAPFPVAERLAFNLGNATFSVSTNGTLVYVASGRALATQLFWKDRSGKPLENFGPPGIYNDFQLSPDEKRITYDLAQSDNLDIWVLDSARGGATRLTFDPSVDNLPIWSPDGLQIAWSSIRGGNGFDLYTKSANGTGEEKLLVKMGSPTGWATDWSKDGFILYQISGAKTGQDLWIAPKNGEPFAYLHSQFDETEGRFSPDEKWIAYVSNETGRDEVYVQSFPLSGAKFQISNGGGTEPQWRKNGAELFYIAADQMLMAVPIKLGRTGGGAFQQDLPRPLFSVSTEENAFVRRNYAVSNDGQRFLMRNAVGGTSSPLTVVLNSQAGLKK